MGSSELNADVMKGGVLKAHGFGVLHGPLLPPPQPPVVQTDELIIGPVPGVGGAGRGQVPGNGMGGK